VLGAGVYAGADVLGAAVGAGDDDDTDEAGAEAGG
jgi:hypothetical protein